MPFTKLAFVSVLHNFSYSTDPIEKDNENQERNKRLIYYFIKFSLEKSIPVYCQSITDLILLAVQRNGGVLSDWSIEGKPEAWIQVIC